MIELRKGRVVAFVYKPICQEGINRMDNFDDSKELSRKFDIILEIEKTLNEIDEAFSIDDIEEIPDKISYLRFLIKELDDILSGEYESLRYRKFVIKREGQE